MVPNVPKITEQELIDIPGLSKGGGLPRSVPSKDLIEQGKLATSLINHGIAFSPDFTFEKLVQDYALAEKIFGKTLLRRMTGYDPRYLKKNLPLPEFQRVLKDKIRKNFENLKKKKIVDKSGQITETGIKLSSLVLYMEELDNLVTKGFGEKSYKTKNSYGVEKELRFYRKEDNYKNIDITRSVSTAIRRAHDSIRIEDLKSRDRKKKGKINIIYAFDTSGSMKGRKIEMAKKAGIALMYKALENKDKVGLIMFRTDIVEKIAPSDDFVFLLEKITKARAFRETNITKAIKESITLFSQKKITKHLILITDAMPTVGKKPEKETLEAAALANNHGITTSLIGINLNKSGTDLAKKITELGKGRLYQVKDIDELDTIVLEDYSDLQR